MDKMLLSRKGEDHRSILKHDNDMELDTKDKRKHITFDEVNIHEHDKLRGTRMRIDEPKTPYHYPQSDSEDENSESGINVDRLQEELENDDEPEVLKELKHKQFEAKRKTHYSEFKNIKELLKKHPLDSDDENEDFLLK